MGDADDSYDFADLEPFVRSCARATSSSTATASRAASARVRCRGSTAGSVIPALSFVGRRLYGTPCGDIYCGLRGFDREKVAALDLRSSGMEFAIEMVVKATMMGLEGHGGADDALAGRRGREPHLNTWRDGWRSIRLLLLYSPKWLFLYPGLVLLALGLAGMAWLVPGQRAIGSVTFDVSTLVYFALAVSVGLQAVYFFLTARVVRNHRRPAPRRSPDPRPARGPGRLELGLVVGVLLDRRRDRASRSTR